ncbi:ELMO domain-containing protein A isoform X3 [Dendrobium catenatum]|uniref:ELMO domain-containing protein A isoform X3 n=1 Tax=Dendrobium catenatum TaxID=906689 RepID=UPI0010A06BAC|nr:ELMO domain-containing protein A isoform X3 [Dendrobium catenatum]XP_028549925.1 ELMO domain-containing protein A isoform X3 [Dendrobium catenatum]
MWILTPPLTTNDMVGPRAWFGGLFYRNSHKRCGNYEKTNGYPLTPLQEQRLQRLKDRLNVPFDETRPDHQDALKALWNASFPETNLTGLVSEQWKDMGWQGANPSTDFRGCGFISLENLLFFARTYPDFVQARRYTSCMGVPICCCWHQYFFYADPNVRSLFRKAKKSSRSKFYKNSLSSSFSLLAEDEEAFDVLYCIAFQMMDAQWLAMRASYLQFNEVLQATRIQLERELRLEDVHRIQDLPAYNLLYK